MTAGREPNRKRKVKRGRVTERRPYENLKKLWDTRWTVNDENYRALIQVAVNEAGSIRQLAIIIGLKERHLRRILKGDSKAVSFRITDQILARSGVAYKLQELEWLTVEEMQQRGIWKPQPVFRRGEWPKR